MQFSVYDVMSKIGRMSAIMHDIEEDKPIDEFKDDIYQLLDEYSEILQSAKVKI